MKKLLKKAREELRKLTRDQRGYGTPELMLIIALIGTITTLTFDVFKTRFPAVAGKVGDGIDTIIESWTTT